MKRVLLACLFLALSLGAAAQAQLAQKKTLDATRIREKISLDAKLDEPAWLSAPAATDFVCLWPTPGSPATQRTVVKILYDDVALYIGVQCFASAKAPGLYCFGWVGKKKLRHCSRRSEFF